MNKIVGLLSLCCISQIALGYSYPIHNNTDGEISVYVYTQAGPTYNVTVAPHTVATPGNTIGWCLDKVTVIGNTKPVEGLSATYDVPGGIIERCRDRDIYIQHSGYIPMAQGPVLAGGGTQVTIGSSGPQYSPGRLKIVIPGIGESN